MQTSQGARTWSSGNTCSRKWCQHLGEAEVYFCRDTWTHNLGYFRSLPHLAIKTRDAFELSFVLPREKMGSLCQRAVISYGSEKSTHCSCLGTGALWGGFKVSHLTQDPEAGFQDHAEMLNEPLSRKIHLSESQLLSLPIQISCSVYTCVWGYGGRELIYQKFLNSQLRNERSIEF